VSKHNRGTRLRYALCIAETQNHYTSMVLHRRSPRIERGQILYSFTDRSFLAAFLYRLFLTVALFALFLPLFGPMLDHHVAERHPYHAHIYFSPSATGHVHFYEDGNSHGHRYRSSNSGSNTLTRNGSGNSEVVYLASSDGLGQSASSLATVAFHADIVYPDPDDRHFLLRLGEGDSLPPEAFVPPPRKPPRA
jgi:hypothetical protein